MRRIVQLATDEFVEWSTVVDAPVSHVLTRAETAAQFGERAVSAANGAPESNRAGANEESVSADEIRELYRRPA